MRAIGSRERYVHQVRIADGARLRECLGEIAERHANHRAAASWLGIKQSTFTRLLNGTTKRAMGFDTYASISRAFGADPLRPGGAPDRVVPFAPLPDSHEALERAIRIRDQRGERGAPTAAQVEEARQALWREETAEARTLYELYGRFIDSVQTDDDRWVQQHYEKFLDRELGRLEAKATPVLRALEQRPDASRTIEEFRQKFIRQNEYDSYRKRCELAVLRALEPLADADDTWGVERSWLELEKGGRLSAYLTAALKREEILLRGRERELVRIRKARPPRSYWEEMAMDAARDHFFEDNPGATERDWEEVVRRHDAGEEDGEDEMSGE